MVACHLIGAPLSLHGELNCGVKFKNSNSGFRFCSCNDGAPELIFRHERGLFGRFAWSFFDSLLEFD